MFLVSQKMTKPPSVPEALPLDLEIEIHAMRPNQHVDNIYT
jgi:hypothetical protein